MLYAIYLALKQVVLFPASFLIAAPFAFALLRRRPGLRVVVLSALLIALYLAATPVLATRLAASLESAAPLTPPLAAARCRGVAVLTGGAHASLLGYEGPQPTSSSLERLRYGLLLVRAADRPLFLIGGAPEGVVESEVLARVAIEEFGVTPAFVETGSRNTIEGARALAELRSPEAIGRLCLVTSSSHMPRARTAFEAQGFEITPAPVGSVQPAPLSLRNFLPAAWALGYTNLWISETIGRAVYWARGALSV